MTRHFVAPRAGQANVRHAKVQEQADEVDQHALAAVPAQVESQDFPSARQDLDRHAVRSPGRQGSQESHRHAEAVLLVYGHDGRPGQEPVRSAAQGLLEGRVAAAHRLVVVDESLLEHAGGCHRRGHAFGSVRFADGWFPLLDVVALTRGQSPVIAQDALNDRQRSRARCIANVINYGCGACALVVLVADPLHFLLDVFRDSIMCALCIGLFAFKTSKEGKTKKERIPLAASKRFRNDSKQLFASIATLCQSKYSIMMLGDAKKG